ncbi:portal protein [Bacillus phage 035JT001]|nr:portal protein [Bacillus phage 035JT001]
MPFKLPEWKEWTDQVIEDTHGRVRVYRDLFYGRHAQLFERAKDLLSEGELTDNLRNGRTTAKEGNVKTPYIIANGTKIVCKVPATMVSRAIGTLSLNEDQEFPASAVEGDVKPDDNGENAEGEGVVYLSDILEDIERQSGFRRGAHYSNILQQQIDGGIVGVPVMDDNGVRIEFKKREVYYPHEDGLGCDLVFVRTLENLDGEMEDFLHVHRQRVEDAVLTITENLYRLNDTKTEAVEESEAMQILEVDTLERTFTGRTEPIVVYWANEPTFDYPLGISAIDGQESKQDEINWTLTRNAITFERNGKPRIAVSKRVMNALKQKALERYGDESAIDHRDMEIIEIDQETGESLQIIQVDITKIGDIKWVKDLLKMMFSETETSDKAIDYDLSGGGGSGAQTGVAKFYDLFTSIMKAERLIEEYVDFIQELVENCFWLMSQDPRYADIRVIRPSVHVKDVIPTTTKEKIETEVSAVSGKVRSKEKAVRNINDRDSDDAIEQELERIEEDNSTVNSNSAAPLALNNLQSMLDNPNSRETGSQGTQAQETATENAENGAGLTANE